MDDGDQAAGGLETMTGGLETMTDPEFLELWSRLRMLVALGDRQCGASYAQAAAEYRRRVGSAS